MDGMLGPSVRVRDWAYESEPDTPILAGEGGELTAAGEPEALDLLALGADGRPHLRAAPNPFNPRTTLTYSTPEAGPVALRIYDAEGRLVRTLFEGASEAGEFSLTWDGRDDTGRGATSGVYFSRLETAAGGTTNRW